MSDTSVEFSDLEVLSLLKIIISFDQLLARKVKGIVSPSLALAHLLKKDHCV